MPDDLPELPVAPDPERARRRRHHRDMLLIAALVVVLAPALEVVPGERVAIRAWPTYVLPETCVARGVFGVSCPGCGLTRSLIHLTRGGWQASLACHRLGWLLALTALFQFPYRVVALTYDVDWVPLRTVFRWYGYFLIFLLVANWLMGLIFPNL